MAKTAFTERRAFLALPEVKPMTALEVRAAQWRLARERDYTAGLKYWDVRNRAGQIIRAEVSR